MMKKMLPSLFLLAATAFCLSAQAQSKRGTMLNHIAQYVVNLQVSTEFYQNIIGLDTIPEPFHDGHHTWFSLGSHGALHIISGAKTTTPHDKNSHLCFSVPSVKDFITLLNGHHIPYENWVGEKQAVTHRVDGVDQIYFQDPDGYWIEINDDHK